MPKFVVAAVLAVMLAAPSAMAQESGPPTLSVTGEGTARAVPDMATVRAGVESDAATAAEALEANSAATARVIAAIKAAGVADTDVQTASFSVEPVYSQYDRADPSEPQRVIGYRVTNEVVVRVRDLDTMGTLLDTVVTTGANRIGGISFGFADETAVADEARKAAVADARRKAELYAAAAGVELKDIVSIGEPGAVRPVPGPRMRLESVAMAVPVERGESEVTASVTIVWEIEDD